MARPTRKGVDYFPLDCNLDYKVEYIEAKHGLLAFAVVVKLWQKIYHENGYYTDWNDKTATLFCKRNQVEKKFLDDVIVTCLEEGVFSQNMFSQHQILTSRGIQKRYIYICKGLRRNVNKIAKKYLINDDNEFPPEETPLIPEETPLIPEESAQRKGKERKGKEKKENYYSDELKNEEIEAGAEAEISKKRDKDFFEKKEAEVKYFIAKNGKKELPPSSAPPPSFDSESGYDREREREQWQRDVLERPHTVIALRNRGAMVEECDLPELMEQFIIDLDARGRVHARSRDFNDHFFNWVVKRWQAQKLKENGKGSSKKGGRNVGKFDSKSTSQYQSAYAAARADAARDRSIQKVG